jgi:hypothetical protein
VVEDSRFLSVREYWNVIRWAGALMELPAAKPRTDG